MTLRDVIARLDEFADGETIYAEWTEPSGKLRPGLRFKGEGRGRCFVVDQTVRSGISCLSRTLMRDDACFPQRRNWQAGDLAACGGFGDIHCVRWRITER